jgi:hypothetical protein
MEAGAAFTVTVEIVLQPDDWTYVIIAVPTAPPATYPDVTPMAATPALLLLHVPPGEAFESVDILPEHKLREPVTGETVFTRIVVVVVQPVGVV